MVTKTDAAWAAGFIDGEGCVSIYPRNNRPSARMSVTATNCDIRPLIKLKAMFGGSVYTSFDSPNPKWNTGFRWQVDSQKAADALEAMIPYLIVKKEQAVLFMEYRTYNRNSKHAAVSEHEERKTDIIDLLKECKRNPINV